MTTTVQSPPVRLPKILESYVAITAVAFLINALFGSKRLFTILFQGRTIVEQIGWGVALALGIGIPAWSAIVHLRFCASLRTQLVQLVGRLDISGLNPLWIAVMAGCGEEALFRGALQPIIGLWLSSLIFMVAHSQSYQFRTMNWQKAIFALLIFLLSLLIGWLFSAIGLIAAIVMHATWDLVGLLFAKRMARSPDLGTQKSV